MPPLSSVMSVVTLSPPMWKRGAQTRVMSSSSVSKASAALMLFQSRLPWVSMAPLGRPVVPEVYMMMATSSVLTSLSLASAAAPETTSSYTSQSPPSDACSARKWRTLRSDRTESTSSMNSAPTTIVCTPASLTMKASSGPARRKFKGTKTAPSLPQAKSTSRNSGTLIVSTATRSPWQTPRSESAVAQRSTCSLSVAICP